MKVEMLKRHQGFKAGDIVEVEEARASYWIGCGVAKKTPKKKVKTKKK